MEQLIVFAYDTELLKHESDDPQKAVLFFHPTWVSEPQRLALCGQLMGVAHFCSSLFSPPSVLTLQSGKFVLKKFGRFFLSVGSDQSLPDWILKERFKTLQSLIEFYHCDLHTIFESVEKDNDNFVKQLHQILESFIPVLQSVVTSVGSVPSLQYSNANSLVFMEALTLLEACTANDGVAGGVVLHNGRVVVSQLSANVNLLACLSDPYRVKSCGKPVQVPFHLPVGVQVLRSFVKSTLLAALTRKPAKNGEAARKKKLRNEGEPRRDKARIFTVHEEEESAPLCPMADVIPKESPYIKLKHKRNAKQKTESNALKERSKNYRANPNISVCSTPTVEKKFIHEEILSICSGKVDPKIPIAVVPDLVQDVMMSKPVEKQAPKSRRLSVDDLMIDLTQKSFPVPLKYYSFGLPRFMTNKPKPLKRRQIYKTLADPLFPVFREDGIPVSKGLYNQCLDDHYKNYLAANKTIDSQEEYIKSKQKVVEPIAEEPKPNISQVSFPSKPKEVKPIVEEPKPSISQNKEGKLFRRPMSLAIKPMTLDNESNPPPTKTKILHTPTTPLMAKLSLLTLEDEQVKAELKQVELPPPSCIRRVEDAEELKREKKKKREEALEEENAALVPCTLFVFGQGYMTLFLILEDKAEQNPDLLLNLWELATGNLDRIETAWRSSMDHVTQAAGSSSYSFLSLDPAWGTVRKYGAWGTEELKVVGALHQDMLQASNITEMILRNEESVVYGYRCGGTETYYQQSGSTSIGLPTPADLMGVITLKAKRRLERDHGIVLL